MYALLLDEHVTDHLLSKIHDEKLRNDVKSVFIPRERLVIGEAVGKGSICCSNLHLEKANFYIYGMKPVGLNDTGKKYKTAESYLIRILNF